MTRSRVFRKHSAGSTAEPPFYNPPNSDDSEPVFLTEWVDVPTSDELLAQSAWRSGASGVVRCHHAVGAGLALG